MANNRIYLHCKKCDDYLFLGKNYGIGYFYHNYDDKTIEKKLNDFYDKHELCGDNFDIRYEVE